MSLLSPELRVPTDDERYGAEEEVGCFLYDVRVFLIDFCPFSDDRLTIRMLHANNKLNLLKSLKTHCCSVPFLFNFV